MHTCYKGTKGDFCTSRFFSSIFFIFNVKASKIFAARGGFEPATFRLTFADWRLYQLSYQDLVEKRCIKSNLFKKYTFLVFPNFWASAPIGTANSCMKLYFDSRCNFGINTFCRIVPSPRRYHYIHWYRFLLDPKRAGSSKIPLRGTVSRRHCKTRRAPN